MKIYMAGNALCVFQHINFDINKMPVYVLQTFYDMRKRSESDNKQVITNCKEFLLDSGAFTFMNSGKKVHWKSYVDEYIEFINKYDIKQFFELDLYTLPDVGIEKTVKMRRYIEHHTGKKSIPVFHACMGLKMYRELCQQYDYIGIGASGLTEECRWVKNTKLIKQMVCIASKYGTKVHGLGYTRLSNINRTEVPFYSVDSSAWIGSRFNTRYDVKSGMLVQSNATKQGERLKHWKQLDLHNLQQWRKIQQLKDTE